MKKMSDADLGELIARRRDASLKHLTDVRANARKEALQFYRGDNLNLYGNSGDGLSTVVSRDVMEAIESMLPGLVKPFVAGDETVRFEPTGPEDEEAAKQATEYINYLFQNHNNAFRVVYDLIKDGLQYRLGVAKVVHEEVDDKQLETYSGLDAMQLQALEADKDREIVGDILQDENGLFEARCSVSVKRSMFRVYVIAPEEFLFEERLSSLDEARFLAHRGTKPIGDWIAMGLPKAKMKKLKSGDGMDEERDNRFEGQAGIDDGTDEDDIARLVTLDECYIRCDYEGTGTLGWRKVFLSAVGNEVILNEEADDHPYECWTPIPVPHKLIGLSIFDMVRDIQMQTTALKREGLNALYLSNRPQREVVEGQVNFEDLLNPEIGGLVRVKAPGMVREIASGGEGVIQSTMAWLEGLASEREARTGVTRYNQGMDANSLNKTATGVSIIQNASVQRQELVARQFAESAMKGIFKKMLGLVCRYLDKEQVIRLRGQWVKMDPTDWKTGYDMSVAVGLGTGNRDQQVGQLHALLDLDNQIIQLQGGAQGPLITMSNVYEKYKRLVEAMGLKGVENYVTDPDKEGEQQPQEGPDPAQAQQQAQQQADIQRFEAESHLAIEKAKLDAHTKLEIARIQAETKVLIAGMLPPPELHATGFDGDGNDAEMPVEAQEPQMAPQMALMPQMMPDEPPAAPEGFGGGVYPHELGGDMA